ncbi:MAG: tetratricopeptide repeat protein [Candidatus Accumulibacter meliphilus]|uniref:tetratricopeptide repeat protein n=1 Tax=Candidatus Accumulibacter meliphilus TaxID=2211374 RepID=UPI002FC3B0AF
MSVSRKKRAPASRVRQAALAGSLTPEAQAEKTLAAGQYRQAIELYKSLLKQERRSEWVDGLAASYAGRAGELAAKGMLSEALVVWRNRASLCGRPLAEGPYVEWLLRAGEHAAALRLLVSSADLSPSAIAELETRLAAVVLTAPAEALAQLAAESPLSRHRALALAAIAACARGDQLALEEQLRAIPFRSPYRDLRYLLKSLLLLTEEPTQAAELIKRVAAGGPFESLAAVVRAALLTGSRWLAALPGLDDEGRQLLLDLKGCPQSRRSLLLNVATMATLDSAPSPGRVLELLLPRQSGLPASAAILCRRLLPYAGRRMPDYERAFGTLAEEERECLAALAAELQGELLLSKAHWLRAAGLLSAPEKAPLQAALILRHLVELFADDGRRGKGMSAQCRDWLERSLALDPADVGTHLKLIQSHRQAGDLRAARTAVDQALAHFATDPAVLLEAVETALAGNAFKKAVALAKRVLALDPINSRVRALIAQAHISHARKQIRARRPEAAGKELDLAEQWLTSASEKSVIKLLRGLSATDAQASALLHEAVAEFGGNLLAAFHVLLEGARLGAQLTPTLRRAGIKLSAATTAREVLAVVHAINALCEVGPRTLATVLDELRAPLRGAARHDFSESERISICEALLRRNERSLLQAYADAGRKRWPERPIFVYFHVFARHGSAAYLLISLDEGMALEEALDKAREEGDQRTALRIRELLSPPPAKFDDEDADDFDDFGDLDEFGEAFAKVEEMLFTNPRAALEMLFDMAGEEATINMAREVFPAGEFSKMERAAGGNRKKLARLLIECVAEEIRPVAGSAQPDPLPQPQPLPQPPPSPPSRVAPKAKPPVHDDRQRDLFDD